MTLFSLRLNQEGRRRPMFFLTSFLGYFFYFLGHAVFPILAIPGVLLLLPFGARRRRIFLSWVFQRYVFFLSQQYLPFLGIYRIVQVSGLDRAMAAGPAVFVANHRSRIDGPLLMSLVRTNAVLIKSMYAHNPLFSLFVSLLDFIPVDPNSLGSISKAIARAKSIVVDRNSRLLVFPEGSRAPAGRLLPFKDLAFRIADQINVPVVPVVIQSTVPFMAKRPGSIFPRTTFAVTVRFLPPERMQKDERPAEFADRLRLIIQNELKTLDAGTVWE
jgi:1-acyl-sn-glycerol-3-phosphate acyltransferase